MNLLLNCLAFYGIGAVVMLLFSLGAVTYDIKCRHIFYTRQKLAEDVLYMTAWSWIGVVIWILVGIERLIRKLL